jgi:hypothetical protein
VREMGVVFDRPVRGVEVRSGRQSNCGGVARILVDIEPAERFELVAAQDGGWAGGCGEELIDWCVAAVGRGVLDGFSRAGYEQPPPVRLVLRRILVNQVDSTEFRNETVGRMAVAEALRRLAKAD